MILTIDIGNSNITFGGFEREEPSFVARLSADTTRTEDEYAAMLQGALSLRRIDAASITGAIVSSVVPPLNPVIKSALRLLCGVEALFVGPGIKTGVNIHCDTPSSVGADLICACVAAHRICSSGALIIDLGTATKMMVLDSHGTFIGVSIIPGVLMGLAALSEQTAQLPKVELDTPRHIVGKNTVECMRSGVIFGNAAMIDGMIDRIREEVGEDLPVIATGGMAPLIVPHCKKDIRIEPDLVLRGLYALYQKNR